MRIALLLGMFAAMSACDCWICVSELRTEDEAIRSELTTRLVDLGVPFREEGESVYYSPLNREAFHVALAEAINAARPEKYDRLDSGPSFTSVEAAQAFATFLTRNGRRFEIRPEEPWVVWWKSDEDLMETFKEEYWGMPRNSVLIRFTDVAEQARYTTLLDERGIEFDVLPFRDIEGQAVRWVGSDQNQIAELARAAEEIGIEHD